METTFQTPITQFNIISIATNYSKFIALMLVLRLESQVLGLVTVAFALLCDN